MSIIFSEVRRLPHSLWLVLALGLILRLTFVFLHQRPLISDEKEYDALAYSLASHHTFAYDSTLTSYRPVGYPACVGLLYAMVGRQPIVVKAIQEFADVGIALLLYLLLGSYPERIRLVGAMAWTFFPSAILYGNLLLSETLFTVLLVVTFWIVTRKKMNETASLVVAGVLVGALVLIKPAILIFAATLPLFLSRYRHIAWNHIALFVSIVLLTLAPWSIRNALEFGHVTLTSNGGINLLIGNNPNSTGAYSLSYDPAILGNARDEFEVDHAAFQAATRYVLAHPLQFVFSGVKKIGRLFESEGSLLVASFSRDPEALVTRYSEKYRSIPLLLSIAINIPYMFIILLGVCGFFSSERDSVWALALLLLGSWIIMHAIVFGGGRFHFPLMPFAILFAVHFVQNLRTMLAGMTRLSRIMAFSSLAALCALWIIEGIVIYNA